jgi:choice-of-anchor B domain-containing protein
VDITKPRHPVYLGKLPTHSFSSTWRDLEVVDNHVYIVSEATAHGMQVFDLTRLRGVTEPQNWTEDAWLGGFGQAHTITADPVAEVVHINGATQGVTICPGGNGGPIMVDVSNREAPTLAGCNMQDGYTHDMQCVIYHGPDTAYSGREICLGSNEDTLTITDVTNKGNPDQLSRTGYATAAYVHQGWFTENHKYFLSNDELDEAGGEVTSTTTYMWDLRDLDNPVMMGGFKHGTQSIDHQLFIKGDIATESNYMSGVRFLGTKKIAQGTLKKLGFFDLYPVQDGVDFAGTWANYPFFDSGTVIATGMEEGLFILRPTGKARG